MINYKIKIKKSMKNYEILYKIVNNWMKIYYITDVKINKYQLYVKITFKKR